MSKLPSDGPDAEVVQPVGLSIGGTFIILGIIGFVLGLDSSGKGQILICGFSALAIVVGFILNRKPKWRMKFSIRTMLIVVALISVGLAGNHLWVLWNTKYELEAYLFVDEDFEKNLKSADEWHQHVIEEAKIFGYEYVDMGPDPRKHSGGVNRRSASNADITYQPFLASWNPKRFGAKYSVQANYFTNNKRVTELLTQVKTVVDRNPDLEFPHYTIKERRVVGNKFTMVLIEEGDPRDLKVPYDSDQ